MFRYTRLFAIGTAVGLLSACASPRTSDAASPPAPATGSTSDAASTAAPAAAPFVTTQVAKFDLPWAMTFLPDGRLLVTEMGGALRLFDPATKRTGTITGTPQTVKVSQGGLGDVVLHPQFARNGLVYLSYVEPGEGELYGGATAWHRAHAIAC